MLYIQLDPKLKSNQNKIKTNTKTIVLKIFMMSMLVTNGLVSVVVCQSTAQTHHSHQTGHCHLTLDTYLATCHDSFNWIFDPIIAGYVLLWNYKKINVYRPDVECTNGIIHVIDYPLFEEKDIVVSGGSYLPESSIYIMLANIIMITVAQILN